MRPTNLRITLYYHGGRNQILEDRVRSIAEQCGGNKAGEWGYLEKGFQCLFMFKKETHFDTFKANLRRELGIDYNRMTISGVL